MKQNYLDSILKTDVEVEQYRPIHMFGGATPRSCKEANITFEVEEPEEVVPFPLLLVLGAILAVAVLVLVIRL